MSLAIDIDQVSAVMIGNEWYVVADASFAIDSYEYIWDPNPRPDRDPQVVHGGGQCGITAAGFSFLSTHGAKISGPLTAIQAVRHQS